jgi:hypothetical protein
MSPYNVKVAVKSGEVYVKVDHGLTGAGHPHLYLRASSSAAPVLPRAGSWPAGLAWSVTDRLRGGGAEKGRVLAVWQELPDEAPVPAAALAWHAHGTGPLYAFDAGHSELTDLDTGRFLTAVLLDALLEIAQHQSAPVSTEWKDCLRWSQAALKRVQGRDGAVYRRENLRRARALSFEKHRPPPAAAGWTKGAWLGTRRF